MRGKTIIKTFSTGSVNTFPKTFGKSTAPPRPPIAHPRNRTAVRRLFNLSARPLHPLPTRGRQRPTEHRREPESTPFPISKESHCANPHPNLRKSLSKNLDSRPAEGRRNRRESGQWKSRGSDQEVFEKKLAIICNPLYLLCLRKFFGRPSAARTAACGIRCCSGRTRDRGPSGRFSLSAAPALGHGGSAGVAPGFTSGRESADGFTLRRLENGPLSGFSEAKLPCFC